jgi:hypothetical protein
MDNELSFYSEKRQQRKISRTNYEFHNLVGSSIAGFGKMMQWHMQHIQQRIVSRK